LQSCPSYWASLEQCRGDDVDPHVVGIHGFEDALVRRPKLLQCEFPVPVSVHQTKDHAHHHRGSDIATATPIVIPGTPNPSFPRPSFQGNRRSSSPSYRRDAGSAALIAILVLLRHDRGSWRGLRFRLSTSLNGDHPAAIQSDVPTN